MKNRFKRFLSITTASATGTLIACIVWYGVYCLSGHREILHSWIPYMVLPICFVTMDFKLLQNIGKKIKKIKELDNPESASVNKSANQEGE